MVVDIGTVQEILADLLPGVMRGEQVAALAPRHPWPKIDTRGAHTGLWWDVQ